jgi:hypothetical protein
MVGIGPSKILCKWLGPSDWEGVKYGTLGVPLRQKSSLIPALDYYLCEHEIHGRKG